MNTEIFDAPPVGAALPAEPLTANDGVTSANSSLSAPPRFNLAHETRFDALALEARTCACCPRMMEREAVLSRANGSLTPRVLFVAEAPGRRGGDLTRVPMSGDASGKTFRLLLAETGLDADEIFITNAVLCNPRKPSGANDKPTRAEMKACNGFLRRQIDLLRPSLVVSVGATALSACDLLHPHGLTLRDDVGRCIAWYETRLLPVYHPSPQVLISKRSLAQQQADWKRIRNFLDADKTD